MNPEVLQWITLFVSGGGALATVRALILIGRSLQRLDDQERRIGSIERKIGIAS